MNIIVLTGRLTRDPELKYGQSGNAYCKFSLAVNKPFKKDEVDFINCVSFGKTAELIGEYVRKGHKLGVQGQLQMNKFEVNGEKRTSHDVMVNQIEFLEGKGDGNNSGGGNNYSKPQSGGGSNYSAPKSSAPAAAPSAPSGAGNFDDDDEFPF